jgi:hypothetical protein
MTIILLFINPLISTSHVLGSCIIVKVNDNSRASIMVCWNDGRQCRGCNYVYAPMKITHGNICLRILRRCCCLQHSLMHMYYNIVLWHMLNRYFWLEHTMIINIYNSTKCIINFVWSHKYQNQKQCTYQHLSLIPSYFWLGFQDHFNVLLTIINVQET